jgi:poly(3-hydroxybutyrate) depolymerase
MEANQRVPVIFALHGALDTTDEMADHTGLDQFAQQHQVLVVYLQGRFRNWPPSIPEDNPDLLEPDFEFVDFMCEFSQRDHQADADRTYIVGVSQGGAMTNAMVVGRSERFAAAVSVCGWLPEPLGETPLETKYKCPMLIVVGTADRQVAPENGRAAHDVFQSAGHPVEWHEIEGFGHGWPKSEEFASLMWDFLARHRRHVP